MLEKPARRAMPFVIALMLILQACATLPTLTNDQVPEQPPEACEEFKVVLYWLGAAGVTTQEIESVIASNAPEKDKIERIRALVGDTSKTVLQAKAHNAAWHALCDAWQPKEKQK